MTSTSNILALDIATKTGWATRINGETKSGVYDLSPWKGDRAEMGWRLQSFVTDKTIQMGYSGKVFIERSFMHGSGDITYLLNGLSFAAHMAAQAAGCPRFEVTPLTLKKATTGNHRASKREMTAKVREWGFSPKDDNEADALALLRYAMEAGE